MHFKTEISKRLYVNYMSKSLYQYCIYNLSLCDDELWQTYKYLIINKDLHDTDLMHKDYMSLRIMKKIKRINYFFVSIFILFRHSFFADHELKR